MAMFDNYLLCQTHEDDVVFRTNDLIGAMLGRVQRFVGTTNVVLVGALLGRLERFVGTTNVVLVGYVDHELLLLGLRIRSIGVRVFIALATLRNHKNLSITYL